jgi:uncharacterized protein HemX
MHHGKGTNLKEFFDMLSQPTLWAALGIMGTTLFNFFLQRHKDKTKLTTSERAQLSMDENDFRKTILEQLKECRESHDEANRQCEDLRQQNRDLHRRIAEIEQRCLGCLYRATGDK